MTLMIELLIYGAMALGVFLLVEALLHIFHNLGDHGENRLNRRLQHKTKEEIEIEEFMSKRHELTSEDLSVDKYFKTLLAHSDSKISLIQLYLVISIMSLVCLAALQVFADFIPFSLCLLISAIIGFVFPIMRLKNKITAREQNFEEVFPDALELIVRNLRIGRPLSAAMKAVAEEVKDPVGQEFAMTSQDIAYGKNLSVAVDDMLKRVSTPSLRFFVVAVQIQNESGGNLAEILEGLSSIIRGRFRLSRKVKALTAEGRFSAWFLSGFPIVMAIVMNSINPGYYMKVADFPHFTFLVAIVAIMLIVNVIAMRIITKLEV